VDLLHATLRAGSYMRAHCVVNIKLSHDCSTNSFDGSYLLLARSRTDVVLKVYPGALHDLPGRRGLVVE